MSDGIARLSVAELLAEVADERVDPDAFDWFSVAMQPVELATYLGVAQVLPVGGFVAGAREAGLFDEGFQQDRPVRVTGMLVVREASGDQGEDARGEVTAFDPRQDEEAGVVDDEVQVSRALLVRPADDAEGRRRAIADIGFNALGSASSMHQAYSCGSSDTRTENNRD